MPATYDELVEEILGNLQGYTLTQDQVTSLSAAITSSETTIPIVMPEGGVGVGVVEVGDEMMYVSTVDENSGTLTLLPRGRGWRGSTAVAHDLGDTVVVSPLVPRLRVKKAVNDAITALWPSLYGVGTSEFTYSAGPTMAWEIPAEAEQLLDVRYQDRHGNWQRVRFYEPVHKTNTTSFATGSSLRITEVLPGGCTVQVVYAKRPTELTTGSAAFTTSGLSASAKDILVWGAMARLVPALDAGRLGVQYVPADELDTPRQLGSATALAREFDKQFALAVAKEQTYLQNRYPARVSFRTAR